MISADLVARYPDQVRTLVAHEPFASRLHEVLSTPSLLVGRLRGPADQDRRSPG
jgi:hypothetical protein